MARQGLRQLNQGVAAPPFTKGPYIWTNPVGDPYPFQTTPWIDFDFTTNSLSVPCRQGAVRIKLTRGSGYALTSWDGNPDTAFKITALNSANNGSNGGIRAIDAQARTNASCSWVKAFEFNARTSSGATVADMVGIHQRMEIYGTVTTTLYGVDIEMSNEGAAATTSAGLLIRNSDASTGNTIGSAIRIANSGTNAGFDYLIDAQSTDACNTAVLRLNDDGTVCNDTNSTGSFASGAGYITVIVGTATRYIHLSSAAPTA